MGLFRIASWRLRDVFFDHFSFPVSHINHDKKRKFPFAKLISFMFGSEIVAGNLRWSVDREENVLINGVVESPERPSEEKLLITFFASLLFTLKKLTWQYFSFRMGQWSHGCWFPPAPTGWMNPARAVKIMDRVIHSVFFIHSVFTILR